MIKRVPLGWLILAVAIVLAVAVPIIREGCQTLLLRAEIIHPDSDSPTLLRQIASEAPDDAYMQLALLYGLERVHRSFGHPDIPGNLPSEEETREHFREIIDRFPDDPAPAVLYAEYLLRHLYVDLPMEVELGPPPVFEPRLPTDEDVAAAREIRAILSAAALNAPENAAIDYMLAWAWLVEDRREEALAALARAAAKPQYTLYPDRLAGGSIRLFEATNDPAWFAAAIAASMVDQAAMGGGRRRRQLARALSYGSRAAREADDPETALEYASAAIVFGAQMREGAWGWIDTLVASAVSAIGHGALAPVASDRDLSPDENSRLRAEAAAAYAREHGRDDLARFIIEHHSLNERSRSRLRQISLRSVDVMLRPITWAGWPAAMATWVTAGVFGIFIVLVVAIDAVYMAVRRRRWPRRKDWVQVHPLIVLGLFAVLLTPGWIAAWILSPDVPSYTLRAPTLYVHPLMAAGVPLWFVGAGMIAAWYGRRDDLSDLTFTEKRLRVAASLIGVTVPALLLASVLAVGWMAVQMNTYAEAQWEVLRVGEVEYFKINASEAEFQARMIELIGESSTSTEDGQQEWEIEARGGGRPSSSICGSSCCAPTGARIRGRSSGSTTSRSCPRGNSLRREAA